jgi:hypothetical protein
VNGPPVYPPAFPPVCPPPLFSKDIVSDAEYAPEVTKVASGFGRFTGEVVKMVRAMPLLGGGPRPWRCCVAGLLSCGCSFKRVLQVALIVARGLCFWEFSECEYGGETIHETE